VCYPDHCKGHHVRRSAGGRRELGLAVGVLLLGLGCASKHTPSIRPMDHAAFTPDVTDAEWAAARVFDKSLMSAPTLLAGKREMEAIGVPASKTGYVKIATVIRRDGSLGVYRILSTNYTTFAEAVAATLRGQRYEAPVLNGEPIALRVEWEYRASRE
jgi:hypothetical protein